MQALRILAGPRARRHLREQGLRPRDVLAVPAAAGGPKGLALNGLDRAIFGQWLRGPGPVVHLLGASIGAWRMACACMPEPERALVQLAEDYVTQRYEHEPGRPPDPGHVSEVFGRTLRDRLAPAAPSILSHPRFRLHVFASRGRHPLLAREGRWRTPLGYGAAFLANAWSRQALGAWLDRVVLSDPRDNLPWPLADFPTTPLALRADNLASAVLASCSIPLWLRAVKDIPGAPPGAYWDGGITDYHLHLPYGQAREAGLVLYPHFQPWVVPGWLDKPWRSRHRATPALDNVVLMVPSQAWVASLPGGKLPDRSDFQAFGDDVEGRARAWRRAVAESARLADEFLEATRDGRPVQAEPLP